MSDDKDKKSFLKELADMNAFTLPRRTDKVELTENQKAIIKLWKRPTATFTARCDYCSGFYSAGFLQICEKNKDGFCGRKPVEYKAPEPTGFSDDELGFYFGIDRKDLDK